MKGFALNACPVMSNSFETLWTVTQQAPLSMGFPRQEYWNGLSYPPPENFPDPGIEPMSLAFLHWQAGSLPTVPQGKPMDREAWEGYLRLETAKG